VACAMQGEVLAMRVAHLAWRCRAVLDLVAVAVELSEFRAIAFHVAVDMNLGDLLGREEAVADPCFGE
jgi:hypothetical protein